MCWLLSVTVLLIIPKYIEETGAADEKEYDFGEADPNLIVKVDLRKYDADEWSIADCKEMYDLFGDVYLLQCGYSFKNESFTNGFVRIHIQERFLEFTKNVNGVAYTSNYRFTDSAFNIETIPSANTIVVNDIITIIINDDEEYNILCMFLKYADYLYENHFLHSDDPLDEFEEVTSLNTTDGLKIFKECFSSIAIESLKMGSANVEEWDMNNKVEAENYGDITLFIGINNKTDVLPISYLDAVEKPQNLWLYITVEGAIRYGMSISRGMAVFSKEDNYEIYVTNSADNTDGRNIKFFNEEDYKKALAYLYIASLTEDYSRFLPTDKRKLQSKSNSPKTQGQPQISHEVNVSTEKDSPYYRLNNLVGLDSIKSDVNNLVNLMKMQIRRREQGLKPVPVSLHLVFSGNPGTGKTTIARILADIYKEIGILSKGHLVEVDRSGLVAGYVGQTAIKTQEKINEALGGILFIDEAYTLVKDGNDYGQEAIDTILKAMEDHRSDFIVIVAGYSDLMHGFINSNPGLKSRFNKYINFPDYTADELIEIFMSMCREYSFELSEDADAVMQQKIRNLEANKGENFANARDVRNIFESVITNQASRLAMVDTDEIMLLTAKDFE